ncbi:Centromere protein x [Globisporangium polare]
MSFIIKPSLVEHVFRGVWEANQSSNGAGVGAESLEDDESDEEAELGVTTTTTTTESTDVLAAAGRVTKISQDALKLSSEFMRLFVVEAFHRAQMEAMVDDSPTIEPHHVEQILAQLLLDF